MEKGIITKRRIKTIGLYGCIGAGKTSLANKICDEKIDKKHDKLTKLTVRKHVEAPSDEILDMYYKCNEPYRSIWIYMIAIIVACCGLLTCLIPTNTLNSDQFDIFTYIMLSLGIILLACGITLHNLELYYENGSLTRTLVQMYFWYGRLKGDMEEIKEGEILLVDRTKSEDSIFAYMQNAMNLIYDKHINIYRAISDIHMKMLKDVDMFIAIKVTPEEAFRNLWIRIRKNRGYNLKKWTITQRIDNIVKSVFRVFGYPFDPEERITFSYITNLCLEYNKHMRKMKEKHGDNFIVINNKEVFENIDSVLKKINDRL